MKLWTAQTIEVYENLKKTGVHRFNADKCYCFYEFWAEPYTWLAEKMKERIGFPPEGVEFPVWFWYKWNGNHHKPDLRSRRSFGTKGQKMVLLEVEIPDNEVLLSDFDSWHFVLNKSHTYYNTNTEQEFDEIYNWLQSLPEVERQMEIEKSWDSIFDITPMKNDYRQTGYWVQATAWELRLENVLKVTPFTC